MGSSSDFWSKVDKNGPIIYPRLGHCWLWKDAKPDKYGQHVRAWELTHGPLPENRRKKKICVCHKCDNKPCVRPSHLFLGTYHDNSQDMMKKGRGRKVSPEEIEALRQEMKGNKYRIGKTLSAAHKEAISRASLGNKHSLLRKTFARSPETREKMRIAALGNKRGLGHKFNPSPETREKMRQSAIIRCARAKVLKQP